MIGISGLFYGKIENYKAIKNSGNEKRIEEKSQEGLNEKFLLQKNGCRIIMILGLIFTLLYCLISIFGSNYVTYSIMDLPGVIFMMIFGYFFLIIGFLIIYFNKKLVNKS